MAAVTQLDANKYRARIGTDKNMVYRWHLFSWRLTRIKQQITLGELAGSFREPQLS